MKKWENVEAISKRQDLSFIVYVALHSFYFLIFSCIFLFSGGAMCHWALVADDLLELLPLPQCWCKAGSSDLAANVFTCWAILSVPITLFMKFYFYISVFVCVCRGVSMEVRGQPVGLSSLLPPCESPRDQAQITRLGSKHHLPAEPSCWPSKKKGKDRKYFFLSL